MPSTRPRQPRLPELCTRKENLFVAEFLANGSNATAAYKATHPRASQATAEANAHKLLKKPRVVAALAVETKARLARLQMDGDEALVLNTLIARADIRRFYGPTGRLLDIREWPDDVALVVKSISETKYGKKLELYDKQHAVDNALKIHKLLKDSVGAELMEASAGLIQRLLAGRQRVSGVRAHAE